LNGTPAKCRRGDRPALWGKPRPSWFSSRNSSGRSKNSVALYRIADGLQ
jgi:hypothetical protein